MAEYGNNNKATFNHEILETVEAGLALNGTQVKSIKAGKAQIAGSFVKMVGGRPQLLGATIPPFQPNNTPEEYDPSASVPLLLSKKQIAVLDDFARSQGLTLIPLKIYDVKGKLKLLVGIAKGKKKFDKRAAIKKKDIARSQQRGIDD